MKHNYKKAFFVIVLLAIIGLLGLDSVIDSKTQVIEVRSVKAQKEVITKKCETSGKERAIEESYDISAELQSNDTKLKITVNPNSSNSTIRAQLEKAVFTLKKINGKNVPTYLWELKNIAKPKDSASSNKKIEVSAGKPIILYIKDIMRYQNNSSDVKLTFHAEEIVVGDCLMTGDFDVFVENIFGGKVMGSETPGGDTVPITVYKADDAEEVINCNNPTSDYEKDYCETGNTNNSGKKITNLGSFSNRIDDNGKFTGDNVTLKCDYKNVSNLSSASSDYFTNITNMTATKEMIKDMSGFFYKYRFAPGNYFKDTAPMTCKIKCTEDIKVEYGPPTATKAGLCFEYKLQVTSYVKCKASELPSPPKQFKAYCNPRPRCVHKNGKVGDRAGPNDNFDDCIEACDGGKYSEKCSKKCYKKVYSNTKKVNNLNYFDYVSARRLSASREEIAECLEIAKKYGSFTLNKYNKGNTPAGGYYGCYYWSGNAIYWDGNTNETPSKFYRDEDPNRDYSRYTVANGDGFIRKVTNGNVCGADCHYSTDTCDQYLSGSREQRLKNEYLNPGVAKEDNSINKTTYEKAVEDCKKAASCKTGTKKTSYTITVNSKNPKDDILEPNTLSGDAYDQKIASSNYLKSFNGCYKNEGAKKIWYKTKWSLGSSWIDAKTGELTYVNPHKAGYIEKKDQLCLPLSQKNVNSKWWNYYYSKMYDANNTAVSVNSRAFKEECVEECGCNWRVNSLTDNESFDWNILGSTRNFGYFKWNIDVKCFYATNSNICDYTGEGKTTCEKCGNTNAKRIRTVDLKQLFPSPDGTTSTYDSTGRFPGYNWTSYAHNQKTTSSRTITNFDSNPSAYTVWVQKKNYRIYSDRYLDYYVELTREKIRTIKSQLRNGEVNYSSYDSTIQALNKDVVHYRSSFLRNTIGATVPRYESALRCNNMKNYYTEGCETFD